MGNGISDSGRSQCASTHIERKNCGSDRSCPISCDMPEATSEPRTFKSRLRTLCFVLLGIVFCLTFGIVLENETGFPFYSTYRIVCAGMCLGLMAKVSSEYPGERWPWVALSIALATNIVFFFTPLFDRPASRGEIMLFALPDVAIFMAARVVSFPVTDDHQRAVRQQLIVGVMLAIAFSTILLSTALIPARQDRPATSTIGQRAPHI